MVRTLPRPRFVAVTVYGAVATDAPEPFTLNGVDEVLAGVIPATLGVLPISVVTRTLEEVVSSESLCLVGNYC